MRGPGDNSNDEAPMKWLCFSKCEYGNGWVEFRFALISAESPADVVEFATSDQDDIANINIGENFSVTLPEALAKDLGYKKMLLA